MWRYTAVAEAPGFALSYQSWTWTGEEAVGRRWQNRRLGSAVTLIGWSAFLCMEKTTRLGCTIADFFQLHEASEKFHESQGAHG